MRKLVYYFVCFVFSFVVFSSCSTKTDPTTSTPQVSTTVSDFDGNIYHTVTIGTQVWMVENLKTTHYKDGTAIPNITATISSNISNWKTLKSAAYCWYGNDISNKNLYGGLYNWYAVNTGKLAPSGWHVPTQDDWGTLQSYISGHYGHSISSASALAATTNWNTNEGVNTIGYNLSTNNYSGFSGLPAGYLYDYDGTFDGVGDYAYWWSSTENTSSTGISVSISNFMNFMNRGGGEKSYGYSVRCVRD